MSRLSREALRLLAYLSTIIFLCLCLFLLVTAGYLLASLCYSLLVPLSGEPQHIAEPALFWLLVFSVLALFALSTGWRAYRTDELRYAIGDGLLAVFLFLFGLVLSLIALIH